LLELAGFSVDRFENAAANLDRFRGSFLDNYDVVYITTHGLANARASDGTPTNILQTSEPVSASRSAGLSSAERRAVATTGGYYSITVPWLSATGASFQNSWVFANACESAKTDIGPASIAQGFFGGGAGGYVGFDELINVTIADLAGEVLVSRLTSGEALREATEDVRTDPILRLRAFFLRVVLPDAAEPSADIALLDDSQAIPADDYYIFDPDRVVGQAQTQPSSGPPGTPLVYRVRIREAFREAVARVRFDIDNTGERVQMTEVADGEWVRDRLTAPVADEYPRIDTFTFTAFNSAGDALGSGSATFTIQAPSAASGLAKDESGHYAE
jgi:hypothetical protein